MKFITSISRVALHSIRGRTQRTFNSVFFQLETDKNLA